MPVHAVLNPVPAEEYAKTEVIKALKRLPVRMNTPLLESIQTGAGHSVSAISTGKSKPIKYFAIGLNIFLAIVCIVTLIVSSLVPSVQVLFQSITIVGVISVVVFLVFYFAIKLLFRISKTQKGMQRMKNTIASIALTKLLDYESQQNFLVSQLSQVVTSLDIRNRFVEFCHSEEFDQVILRQIGTFKNSPESFITGVSYQEAEEFVEPIREVCIREGLRGIPSALALFSCAPFTSNDQFHRDLLRLISRQLDALSSDVVSDRVYAMLEAKRIQFALCGNVAGLLFGILAVVT
jgi:hypothetical protein